MDNLSQKEARNAITGFGMNRAVDPAVRAAIGTVSLRLKNESPENFEIVIDLSRDIDPAEILQHFPDDMHDNFRIQLPQSE